MSIQSEIDRIAGAKPILGNYLQQNGVAVPSGATLDEMALLLADVIGTKSQEKIVNLSMASGNQVITPDDGYTLSKVTVTKPDTLIPDNIKKDVNIGGVVGSMSGGGAPSLQSKSVTYTANGTATITPDDGYDGLSSVDVTVNVSGGGGVGYIAGIGLKNGQFACDARDLSFNGWGFDSVTLEFFPTSTNVSFIGCAFINSTIKCTQRIRDAIENGSGNYVNNVQFDIVT